MTVSAGEQERPLVALVGPTAVGKTAVGIALAKALDGEIISADAVAVYQGLDIGSAKPTFEERQEIPFHLIDVVRPDEDFTLADFALMAERAIAEIRERGRTPIVVGGTGLYVRSVTATLSMPNVPPQPELRAALWAEAEEQGAAFLHGRLQKADPEAALKILPGDAKRIIRALEVYMVTGRPMSSFHTSEGIQGIPRPNTCVFGMTMARERLYQRIDERVDAMIAAGFVEEVRALLAQGYGPECKSMQSLGYRHLTGFLQGKIDWEPTVHEWKRDTRRYAKRQMIWFKADSRIIWYDRDTDLLPSVEGSVEILAETIADVVIERTTNKKSE